MSKEALKGWFYGGPEKEKIGQRKPKRGNKKAYRFHHIPT